MEDWYGKTAVAIELSESERRELEGLASRRKTAQGLAQRARIILLAAEGLENKDISLRVEAAPNTVGKWRRRFAKCRIDGLYDEPRPGAPRQIGDDEVAEIIRQSLETPPRDATHWSLRSMAKAAGFAPSTIHRIWKAFNLQPHRTETFKLSTDPLFVEKVRDIVGLYLSPPERALVLCVDEEEPDSGARSKAMTCCLMHEAEVEQRARWATRATGTLGTCWPLSTPPRQQQGHQALLSPPSRTRDPELPARESGNVSRPISTSTWSWTVRRPWGRGRSENGWARMQGVAMHVHFTPTASSWVNQVECMLAAIAEESRPPLTSAARPQGLETAVEACLDAVGMGHKPLPMDRPPTAFSPP